MSTLAKIGAGMAGAAVAGFGLSAGRSTWNKASKNILPLLAMIFVIGTILGAVGFPFYGGREISRGHDRRPIATFFLTILTPLSCLVLGFGAAMLADQWIQGFQGLEFEEGHYRYSYIIAVTGISFGLGLVVGLFERRGRKNGFALIAYNDRFLRIREISETLEPGATHADANGNRLRYIERSGDRISFLAVGRRNKRAYISLSATGKMLAYSGVMNINQHWDGHDFEEVQSPSRPSGGTQASIPIADINSLFGDEKLLPQLIAGCREFAELHKPSGGTEEIREVLLKLSDHYGWYLFRHLDEDSSDLDAVSALIGLSTAAFPNFNGTVDERLNLIKRNFLAELPR